MELEDRIVAKQLRGHEENQENRKGAKEKTEEEAKEQEQKRVLNRSRGERNLAKRTVLIVKVRLSVWGSVGVLTGKVMKSGYVMTLVMRGVT